LTRKQLWGGRFSEPPAQALKAFNDSFAFDRALLAEDVRGSIGWAQALGAAGVLTAAEVRKLASALEEVAAEAARAGIPADADDEDVHSFVEGRLAAKVGPLSGKLHTGRSRNDQVATDFRLYVKDALAEGAAAARALALALARRAEAEAATPMPGYTHLKRAEPVTFGHWCLAYVEMLRRDAARFDAAFSRADECPLGSGALSGTPVPVDREALARGLGFLRPTANSLDAVSDRDAAAEYLFTAALLFVHLSRLAEDLIAFTSDEFGFAALPDALATGSSRMPQKKNPDVLELARGHAGRTIGELTGLLALLKGLPLAYDKDLQLDKEPVFRVRSVLPVALLALTGVAEGLRLDRERMAEAASDDRLLATELADALAKRGIPFREAHEIVGRRIAEAEALGVTLLALGPKGEITAKDLQALDVRRALAKRDVFGGTAPRQVARAARAAVRRLSGGVS
jgi:argininosuccinate lyase